MNRFEDIISKEKYNLVLKNINTILKRNSVKFQERLPCQKTKNGIYHYDSNFYDSFHGGFWTGIYYHGNSLFGDNVIRSYADSMTEKLYTLIKTKRICHKEMGLFFLPVCMEDIKLNHSIEASEIAILAADYMIEGVNEAKLYSYMSMLTNLLILYFAYKITNDNKYKKVAELIEDKCITMINFDSENMLSNIASDVIKYGYSEKSGDIRPYAWTIHGLGNLYSFTGNESYEDMLYRVLKSYLSMSKGSIKCFMSDSASSDELTDTTSTAIIICGLFELLKYLPFSHPHYNFYYVLLKENFSDLVENYMMDPAKGEQGILDGGVMLLGTPLDCNEKIKNSATICGDYFFMEALMHLNPNFHSCWDINNIF